MVVPGSIVRDTLLDQIGKVSFTEDGLVWIVWPPSETSHRYSASGIPLERLVIVEERPQQIRLIR